MFECMVTSFEAGSSSLFESYCFLIESSCMWESMHMHMHRESVLLLLMCVSSCTGTRVCCMHDTLIASVSSNFFSIAGTTLCRITVFEFRL